MPAPIGDLAQFSGPAQQEKARVQIGAAPKVDPDAAGQTLQRSTVSFVDIQSDGQDREAWSDADIRAELRELRRMLLDGAAVSTAQSVDPGLRPYQVIDQLGNVIGESDTLGVLPDVVLSRGSYSSLSSRLDDLSSPVYGSGFLRQTRMLIEKIEQGDSGTQLIVDMLGDSYTQNRLRYSGPLTKKWQTRWGNAGAGWIGFGWAEGAMTGTWTDVSQPTNIDGSVLLTGITTKIVGTWTCSYNVGANNTPSLSKITSSTAGDYVSFDVPAGHSVAKLYYTGDGTGVVALSWNDGSSYGSNITLNPVGPGILDLGTVTTGGVARIKVVSGNVALAGVELRSTAIGVRVHKLAGSGSNTAQWAGVTQATWGAQVQSFAATLVLIFHGTNDQTPNNAISPAASAANLTTIIANVRSVTPKADILIVTPAENARVLTNKIPMQQYAAAHRAVAIATRCAHVNFQGYFGDAANNAVDYDSDSPLPLLNSDGTHPDLLTGGRILSSVLDRFTTQSV